MGSWGKEKGKDLDDGEITGLALYSSAGKPLTHPRARTTDVAQVQHVQWTPELASSMFKVIQDVFECPVVAGPDPLVRRLWEVETC